MQRRERKPSFRKWKCPGCGAVYSSPVPILEAVCQRVLKHSSRASRAMKPVKEAE